MFNMDFSSKGISWVGNVYQKLEDVCVDMLQEVDNLMALESSTNVENRVQTVGKNVQKFCDEVVQDFLSPSSVPSFQESAKFVEKQVQAVGKNVQKLYTEVVQDLLSPSSVHSQEMGAADLSHAYGKGSDRQLCLLKQEPASPAELEVVSAKADSRLESKCLQQCFPREKPAPAMEIDILSSRGALTLESDDNNEHREIDCHGVMGIEVGEISCHERAVDKCDGVSEHVLSDDNVPPNEHQEIECHGVMSIEIDEGSCTEKAVYNCDGASEQVSSIDNPLDSLSFDSEAVALVFSHENVSAPSSTDLSSNRTEIDVSSAILSDVTRSISEILILEASTVAGSSHCSDQVSQEDDSLSESLHKFEEVFLGERCLDVESEEFEKDVSILLSRSASRRSFKKKLRDAIILRLLRITKSNNCRKIHIDNADEEERDQEPSSPEFSDSEWELV